MKQMILSLNDAYDYIETCCQDPQHPKVAAMLEAIDDAISIIEKAEKVNQKFTKIFEYETAN